LVIVPASIPSPSWQVFDLTQWFSDNGWNFLVTPFHFTPRMSILCMLVGFILAIIITSRRLTKRGAEPGVTLDLILWAIPLGVIFGRIYHILTNWSSFFGEGKDLFAIFNIWDGGIAVFGALIGGAIGVFIGGRLSGIRFWTFADVAAPGLLVGQAFIRLSDYFDEVRFGTPTDLPWGLQVSAANPSIPVGLPDDTLFQPTFLYDAVWCLIGAALILLLERKFRLQWGKAFGSYLIWYGLGRVLWETMRVDPSGLFLGVRTNVWVAWLAVVVGLAIIIVQTREHPGQEPSPYRPGAEWSPSGPKVESQDTYSDEELRGDVASEDPEEETIEPNAKSEVGAKS
jgi:prolipoprotein diacylglyceryl transferase